jgi:U3 small nucleolar RNA-associated protein 6
MYILQKMYSSVSRMLERMLRVHHDKPSMWKLAANWEYEDCGSIERARQFLLQGLRHHPESSMLYLEVSYLIDEASLVYIILY